MYEQLFEISDFSSEGVRAFKGNVDTGFTPEYPPTEPSEVRDVMG